MHALTGIEELEHIGFRKIVFKSKHTYNSRENNE